jgi:aryl-alcohol dehydrogenase (NADP+)
MTTAPPRRRLGGTDLEVFPINLGGNVFRWTADDAASFAVLDAYRAAGGNFIDTADVYSAWAPGHVGGESESLLGAWLASRRCRAEMVIATKVGAGGPGLAPGLTADQIRRGCDASLRRLGVDTIDLYYAHRDDAKTPLEETLAAFDGLVRAGKVRWLGASNFTAPRLEAALDAGARLGLSTYAVVQPEYNLVVRDGFEGPLSEVCQARTLGACTYYALASGFLTGKYGSGSTPATPRAKRVQGYLDDPRAVRILQVAKEVAVRNRATVAQVALAWQLAKRTVTAPIASATSVQQLEELLGATRVTLGSADMTSLDRCGN